MSVNFWRQGAARCAFGICLLLLAACAGAQGRVAGLPDFTGLVNETSPAVVNISTTQRIAGGMPHGLNLPEMPDDHPLRPFIERFGGNPPREQPFDAESLGSGFIISDDGFVLTNYHVVRGADEIVVRLSDRREYIAEAIGYDERSDLAVLKIDATDLPVARTGKAADLQVGEWVLAIGSPFGFEHSATAGIVSAKGRSLPQGNYVPFIQTDVAINPGNSGGPLFNLDGEVVGINSHIYSRTGGFMGVSFAIPIELALDVAEQLRTSGKVVRGWLGVLIQDVTRDLAESFGMSKPIGALVAEVVPGSPAASADLRAGDVILEYDGREVPVSAALPPLVGRSAVGESVRVRIMREGKERTVTVRIAELPEQAERVMPPTPQPQPDPEGMSQRLGLHVEPLPEERRKALEIAGGVLVRDVAEGPAQQAGVQPGDVIAMLNHQRIGSVEEFRDAVKELPAGRSVPVLVHREGGARFFAIKVPPAR
jgi:serine protease Do